MTKPHLNLNRYAYRKIFADGSWAPARSPAIWHLRPVVIEDGFNRHVMMTDHHYDALATYAERYAALQPTDQGEVDRFITHLESRRRQIEQTSD